MPKMNKLHRRLESQGLVLIGVHTKGGAERMPAYVKEAKVAFPVAVDTKGKTVAAYAVDSYPDYYVIDRAGKVRFADLANSELERAVDKLLAEPAPKAKKKVKKKAKAKSSGVGEKADG